MIEKHLCMEIKSYKELVDINQKNIVKNVLTGVSCSYLCLAFCFMYVNSVLKNMSIVSIIPFLLFFICCVYTFKSIKSVKICNRNIELYKNKIKDIKASL